MAAVTACSPRVQTSAAVIEGVHTDFVLTWYSNKLFVVVSQFQKFGTLVHISKDQSVSATNPDAKSSETFTTKVLMGDDQSIWHVYGQEIWKTLNTDDNDPEANKPLLLAIALKSHSPEILRSITKKLESMRH